MGQVVSVNDATTSKFLVEKLGAVSRLTDLPHPILEAKLSIFQEKKFIYLKFLIPCQ